MDSFLVPAVFVAIAVLLYGFAMFDRLVRWEHLHQPDQWIADGKPDGFFWRATGTSPLAGDSARHRLLFRWLFSAPSWALTDQRCRAALFQFRAVVLLWNAAFLGIILFRVFHQ